MTDPAELLNDQLRREHSRAHSVRLAEWIGNDAERFAALMKILLGADYRLGQRSAWVLFFVAQKSPELLTRWWPEMVAKMREPGVHHAIKRNVVRVLQDLEIPGNVVDELADACFRFLADPQETVAVRVFSMSVLEKICRNIPELKPELRLLIEEHLEFGTPAFKNRGRRILNRLEKI